MPNIKIKDIHGKDHTYLNKSTLRVRDADNEGQYVEYTYKNGTVNVNSVGETDVNEFAKVNVTVREYTAEMETDHNETLDLLNDLLDEIIAEEDETDDEIQEQSDEADSE